MEFGKSGSGHLIPVKDLGTIGNRPDADDQAGSAAVSGFLVVEDTFAG